MIRIIMAIFHAIIRGKWANNRDTTANGKRVWLFSVANASLREGKGRRSLANDEALETDTHQSCWPTRTLCVIQPVRPAWTALLNTDISLVWFYSFHQMVFVALKFLSGPEGEAGVWNLTATRNLVLRMLATHTQTHSASAFVSLHIYFLIHINDSW